MRLKSIANHLRPYRMLASRQTTVNHMFAAAVAPHDPYDEARVREAVALLGDDPDRDLACAYCGAAAETWDHVFATVRDSRFSGHGHGHGHRLGNLLPCCKPCNSRKGNKHWRAHLNALAVDEAEKVRRQELIDTYLLTFDHVDELAVQTPGHRRLDEIRQEILALMAEADAVAERVRTAVAPAN